MPNIAFLIDRQSFLKFMGSIIEAALARGWTVECWYGTLENTEQAGAQSGSDGCDVAVFVNGRPRSRQFRGKEEIPALIAESGVGVICSIWPRAYVLPEMPAGCKFVILQEILDTITNHRPEVMASSDLVCLLSPFWLEWAGTYYERRYRTAPEQFSAMMKGKVAFSGFPQADVFSRLERTAIRKKWNIPPDRPVVLLLPSVLRTNPGIWGHYFSMERRIHQFWALFRLRTKEQWSWKEVFRYVGWTLRGWNERQLAKSIQKFCQRNDAFLIIKARKKDPLRPYFKDIGNLCLYDESFFPATILEAIAVSDLCIHFFSTAALEASAAGVPCLCVDIPSLGNYLKKGKPTLAVELFCQKEPETAFNFKGVSTFWRIPEVIRKLPGSQLSTFRLNKTQRSKYIEKYIGPIDGQASERVLDAVLDHCPAAD